MAKISACIISFNEEKKIEDCIRSLLPVVDEIVVVDSLSTDRTKEIAARYTDRIYDQTFLGHIEQKNLAIDKASHEWILSLDCDERLSAELQQSILAIKEQLDDAPGEVNGYKMARKTFYIYTWLNHCWYPDIKTRLFNRKVSRWGGVNPHDHLLVSEGEVRLLQGDIQHYSFDSISQHMKTIDSFTEIGAREIIKRGKKVSLVDPFTHGFWTFFKTYFIKRGFLDGFPGIVVSMLSGMHVFVKYSKVIMMRRAGD